MLTGLYLPELSDILTAITQSAIIKPGVGVLTVQKSLV